MKSNALSKTAPTIGSVLRMPQRRTRSVRLDRDLADPATSRAFVPTPFAMMALRRLLAGAEKGSNDRAWRLTGDYGTGKSTLIMALCHLVAGHSDQLPAELKALTSSLRLSPIAVIGDREPIGRSILRAIATFRNLQGGTPIKLPTHEGRVATAEVLSALDALHAEVTDSGSSAGLLLVLDELGKNLEFAASRPEADDIYLLQSLAERASRSGENPFMFVAVLHQAVAGYATGLSSVARREWEKVAGRLSEIVFAPPIEQTALLVSRALDVDVDALADRQIDRAHRSMALAVRIGWYGNVLDVAALEDLAPRLFPLDPLVLPVLGRVLRRFGQNERSLFGFLSSAEPDGLLDFANRPLEADRPYGLANLYDYVRSNLANQFGTGTAAGRWAVVDAVVSAGVARSNAELDVLKIVGILNLLDDPMLSAVRAVVRQEVGDAVADPDDVIGRLEKDERILYRRGIAGGLYLWPNSSVNLDEALEAGLAAIGQDPSLSALIALLPTEALVARRHYSETGALRHFQRIYATLDDLPSALRPSSLAVSQIADGRLVVVVPESEAEREVALSLVRETSAELPATTLAAIAPPVGALVPLLRDIEAWSWVRDNISALSGDKIAREEVVRQIGVATDSLNRALQGLIEGPATTWIHCGAELDIRSGRQLLAYLSDVCDKAFDLSPIVKNELINRRTLSSAAARARYMLIEALASNPSEPGLGISDAGVPPERAIYLSMLHRGGVHIRRGEHFTVVIPSAQDDRLRLAPSLDLIGDLLRGASDGRVRYETIVDELRGGRYGVRDGLIPLLIAIYLAAHWHHTAVYEDGTYLDQVGGPEFNRMVKEPEHFELQHCAIEGVRAEVFAELAGAVGVTGRRDELDLLDVVRPMAKFISALPDQARRTRRLTVGAIAIREALLSARDPKLLVFSALPVACGLPPISTSEQMPAAEIATFVTSVRSAMRELRDAYPDLIGRLFGALALAFEASHREHGPLRAELMARAEAMTPSVTEVDLRTFLLRLGDRALDERAWMESLASTLAKKPPERWGDGDEAEFHHRLPQLARRFRRVEAVSFNKVGTRDALRLVVTSSDGREVEDVLRSGGIKAKALDSAEEDMRALLERHGRAGVIAAARLILNSR